MAFSSSFPPCPDPGACQQVQQDYMRLLSAYTHLYKSHEHAKERLRPFLKYMDGPYTYEAAMLARDVQDQRRFRLSEQESRRLRELGAMAEQESSTCGHKYATQ